MKYLVTKLRGERARRLLLIGLAGLLFRLLLMPFTMHFHEAFTGDLLAMHYHAYSLFLAGEASDAPPSLYPPLAYYTLAFWQWLIDPLLPALGQRSLFGAEALVAWLADPYLFRLLFWLKALYLPFDYATAYLLYHLGGRGQSGVALFTFWILNPIVIFTAYIHGQFDIIPAFFTVLALLALQKERPGWAGFWIGIAACFKNYALIFLPFVIFHGRSRRERLGILIIALAPYLTLLLTAGRNQTLATIDYRANLFPLQLELPFGQFIFFYLVAVTFITWFVYHRQQHNFEQTWRWMTIVLLLYFSQALFNHHYLTWLIPLAGLAWLSERELMKPYLFLLLCSLTFFLREPIGQYWLPLAPELLGHFSRPIESDALPISLPLLIDVARSAFVGVLLWITYRLWQQIKQQPIMESEYDQG